MTKKEQKAVDEQVKALKLQLALRWTPKVEKDLPKPESGERTKGFLPIGSLGYSPRVELACSGAVSHGIGSHDRTTTQCGIDLYSTRLLALQALRNETEKKAAQALYEIDIQIERELAGGEQAQ